MWLTGDVYIKPGGRGNVQETTGLSIKQERSGWTPPLFATLAIMLIVCAWSLRRYGWEGSFFMVVLIAMTIWGEVS